MKFAEPRPIQHYCLGIYDGPHATPKETDDGPVFLGIKNITDDGAIDLSEIRHVSEEEYPRWTRRVTPQSGDVVFTYEATLHRYALIPEGFRGCLGRRVALVRPDPNQVDSRYLLYFFMSNKWRQVVESNVITGATVDRIPLERFPSFPAALPRLPVQQRIADILSAYDDLMKNNRRRMVLLEDAVRQLYSEWFVRLGFPGHEHAEFWHSDVGRIPRGWRPTQLCHITTKLGSGATPRGGEAAYQSDGVALIRSLNIYDAGFEDDGLAFLNEEQAAHLDNVSVEPNDILLNITGASVARCCLAPERHLPARVNQHVMIVRVDPTLADPHFVLQAINSDENKRRLLSLAHGRGATREALTKNTVGNFEIVLPEGHVLDRFGEQAREVARQREVLAAENASLRTARDLLLPRLMDGRIAV
jgi:type I restriction enzyme S subunit